MKVYHFRNEHKSTGNERTRQIRTEHLFRRIQCRIGGKRLPHVGPRLASDRCQHRPTHEKNAFGVSERIAAVVGRDQFHSPEHGQF